jgi:hypothetical protein
VAFKPAVVIAWSSLLLLGLTGCTGSERLSSVIYDGLRAREDLVAPSSPRSVGRDKPMTYSEYDAERRRLLEGDTAR